MIMYRIMERELANLCRARSMRNAMITYKVESVNLPVTFTYSDTVIAMHSRTDPHSDSSPPET